MSRTLKVLSLALCCQILIHSNSVSSAEKQTFTIPRVDSQPTIDGDWTQQEWSSATKVSLDNEIQPGESTPAKVVTEAYIMEDGEHLYISFIAKDPNPEEIRAFYRDRDSLYDDDFVGVILDTFNAERRGFEFFVNPLGAQADLTRDDTRGNEDDSWNTLWESAGKLTEFGYVVEMAVPFRSVRFPANKAQQTWGISFLRVYPRDARYQLSDSTFDRNIDCTICQYNKITGFANLNSGDPIELTPTLTSIKSRSRDPIANSDWPTEESDTDIGLDVRWAITEDWIANATINPDFSQVEADDAQLSVNETFALFVSETRPFFLEGRDYFETQNNLVYTRNVANPEYGVKVTGKTDGMTHAFLLSRDENTGFVIPGSLFSRFRALEDQSSDVFVGRVQQEFGEQNNVGLLVTNREGGDYKNTLFSLDGRYYFTEADHVRLQVMSSDTDNPQSLVDEFEPEPQNVGDTNRLIVKPNQSDMAYTFNYRHNTRDYNLRVDFQEFGDEFRADTGFINRVNYNKRILGGTYRWYGESDSRWTRWQLWGDWDLTKNDSGLKIEEEVEMYFGINGPFQSRIEVGGGQRNRFFDNQYFDEKWYQNWIEIRPTRTLWIGNFFRASDRVDIANSQLGQSKFYEPNIEWQIGQHLFLDYSGVFNHLDVPGGRLFTARVHNLRIAYQFDLRSRLRLTTQARRVRRNTDLYLANNDTDPDNNFDRVSDSRAWQLLYSYKLNPQSVAFVGYSSSGFRDDRLDEVREDEQALFVKFSYVWQN